MNAKVILTCAVTGNAPFNPKHPAMPVTYLPHRSDVVHHALRLTRPGDVLLTLGAGDINNVIDEWLAAEVPA